MTTDPNEIIWGLVEVLKAERLRLGWSLGDVERAGGPAKGTLSHVETYRYVPTLPTLIAWAGAMGCDIELALRPRTPAVAELAVAA